MPVTPPVWAPTPISGFAPPPQPANQEMVWIPQATSRIDSLMRRVPRRSAEEEEHRKRTIVWTVGATLVVGMIMGILWLLRGQPPTATWEQTHRDEILTLKDDAESLALSGNDQQAYSKYQELERLVTGQTITDPFLLEELSKSWIRRDALFDKITSAHRATATTTAAEPPATEPAPPPQANAPPVGPENPIANIPIAPTTFPEVAVQTAPPPPKRVIDKHPPVRPDIPAFNGLTDAQIGEAIGKGVDYLLAAFSGPELSNLSNYEHSEGLDTLVVYALMQAELATHDKRLDIHSPFMINAIDAMKKFPMATDYVTYARCTAGDGAGALRPAAGSPDDSGGRELAAEFAGARGVHVQQRVSAGQAVFRSGTIPIRNTGCWASGRGRRREYRFRWISGATCAAHWTKYQLPDGQWCYRADQTDPSRSMTLAGIASLFVAQDYLDAEDYGEQVGRPPFTPALDKALKWLESDDNSVIALPQSADFYTYYTLYGLERTGLASGFKYYGAQDWYR